MKELTPDEKNFIMHYGRAVNSHAHDNEVFKWIHENHVTIIDFENLMIAYQNETGDIFWQDVPSEPLVIPFKDREEVLARNAEFARDNA